MHAQEVSKLPKCADCTWRKMKTLHRVKMQFSLPELQNDCIIKFNLHAAPLQQKCNMIIDTQDDFKVSADQFKVFR